MLGESSTGERKAGEEKPVLGSTRGGEMERGEAKRLAGLSEERVWCVNLWTGEA
jgi:hypothetical protein